MRPVELILENIGSFRGRHQVDFRDIDLFVLSGPTGAGKSTIIDAITVALYGSVARYDNTNLIEPAVNKLATQAAVSLTFDVAGARYLATRVIRRTAAGGASAAECRLERVLDAGTTTTLASGSREVSAHVSRLLGLTFDEFCKTVVLPQGAFAQFLHGGRAERNEMLVRLLGLEVYSQLGKLARARAQRLEARLEVMAAELDSIAHVDDRAVQAAEAHAAALDAVRRTVVDDLLPALDELREQGAARRGAVARAEEIVQRLAAVAIPDGVEDLSERVRGAEAAIADARGGREQARARLNQARAVLAAAPAPGPVDDLLRVDDDLRARRADVEHQAGAAAQAAAVAEERERAAQEADTRARDATATLTQVERANLAHVLAEGLEPGDACPVCRRPVDARPEHPADDDLDAARAAAADAAAAASAARQAAASARGEAERAHERERGARQLCADLERQMDPLAARCGVSVESGLVDRVQLEALRARSTAAQADVEAAEAALEQAEAALEDAAAQRAGLDAQAEAAWERLTATRDTVAALGAPPPDRRDLAGTWRHLAAWSAQRLTQAREEARAAEQALEEVKAAYRAAAQRISQQVTAAQVTLSPGASPQQALDALVSAATSAQAAAETARRKRARAEELRREHGELDEQRQVAELVASLLRRDSFEQWLLTRLSARLVAGASRILDELTQGGFSLATDADRGGFEVIDHLNADERRPAKTLSGGETFLASLALALALAEHVADVGGSSAARLDALFLDEGFGTLDGETLETVASAIEELSGSRLVGVVTHVRELAARIPHRFEVQRGPEGSHVRLAGADEAAGPPPLEAVAVDGGQA